MKILYRNKEFLFIVMILGIIITFFYTNKNERVYAYELPSRLCIDYPRNNSNINSTNQVYVGGWSLDASGVKSVQIYLDNSFVGNASIGISRPDVNAVYPGYKGGENSGYGYTIDLSDKNDGVHNITVKSIGNTGTSVQQTTCIIKTKPEPRLCIDAPVPSQKFINGVQINGWSLNMSGVKEVKIYIDNSYKGSAALGIPRPDVNNVYPGYTGGATSGYTYYLDLSEVSEGSHSLVIESIGNDGSKVQKSVVVNKAVLPSQICIDTPATNGTIKNRRSVDISGWSLNQFGVKTVQIYLDNVYKGDASIGGKRSDVDSVYPGYTGGATSGFYYNLDLSGVSDGSHIIVVKSIGNTGMTAEKSISINKYTSPSRICIDAPYNNRTVKNQKLIDVYGWSLDQYGVKNVQIYLDNVYKGNASIGGKRPDVDGTYPGYLGGASSGFYYNLDLSGVADGTHTIIVKSTGDSGNTVQQSITINKVTSLPQVCIDSPKAFSFVDNQATKVYVGGWSLNAYGVKNVQVYLDNEFKGNASIGGSRPDVNSVYPGYLGGGSSGYNYELDLSSISSGNHTITINSIGNDDVISSKTIQIYKKNQDNKAMPSLICIDTPSNNTFINNHDGSLFLGGWSLNAFGVKNVQVYLDNIYKADVSIGGSRPDVNSAYPGYLGGATSGFGCDLNLSDILDGVHIIKVISIGNDGTSTQQSIRIYKFSGSNQFITGYSISLQDMVTKQLDYGEPVMDQNGNWVKADRNTVQYYVDSMNFMDNYGIYQFLKLDYIQGVSADDLNKILSGKGVLNGKGAQFLDAAQNSNINPIYLVAHSLLETGNGTSALATGINANGQVVYNLFGIHAFDSNPNYYGSQYAYSQGWTTVDSAIYGGAQWISSWYINNSTYKQNTLYKMRWNPNSPTDHQYATDVKWAYNQVYNIKRLTDMCANPILQFDIPQYR